MLIPHYIVLIGLWVAFAVLTLAAYIAVLVTGRYPRSIFAFNVGVMRWSWRVNYYGYQALGTDRYPPFTLADVPDYPARLQVDQPPPPPRWLSLVAWLFAIPHILLIGALTGAATWQFDNGDTTTSVPLGVVSVGVLIAALSLLFTARYPRGLYDLLLGIARWNIRVTAYVALLTSVYPPFRLDQGEHEPDDGPSGPSAEKFATGAMTGPGRPGDAGPMAATGGSVSTLSPAGSTTRSAAGPVTALIAGVLLMFAGMSTGVGGGALLALANERDASGYVTSPTLQVASSTAAITAEGISLQAGDVWSRTLADVGEVRITATSPSGAPLFIGVAPQTAVDGWLSSTAHDQLMNVNEGAARYERARGTVQQVAAPSNATFWLATASSTGTAVLNWNATDGDFAVVLANADGTPGVVGEVRVATQIPDLTPLGAGLLGTGTVLALLAVALIITGGTGLGRRHAGPATTTGPPVTGVAPAAPPPDTEPPSTRHTRTRETVSG